MDHSPNYGIPAHRSRLAGLAAPGSGRRVRNTEEEDEIKRTLREAELFQHLSDAGVAELAAKSHHFTYPANWAVAAQGTVVEHCLMIESGEVRMTVNREPVRTLAAGDIIGMTSASQGTLHREAGISVTRVAGVAIPVEEFFAAIVYRGASIERTAFKPVPRLA